MTRPAFPLVCWVPSIWWRFCSSVKSDGLVSEWKPSYSWLSAAYWLSQSHLVTADRLQIKTRNLCLLKKQKITSMSAFLRAFMDVFVKTGLSLQHPANRLTCIPMCTYIPSQRPLSCSLTRPTGDMQPLICTSLATSIFLVSVTQTIFWQSYCSAKTFYD